MDDTYFFTLILILVYRLINRNIRRDLKAGIKVKINQKVSEKSKTKKSAFTYIGVLPNQMLAGSFMEHQINIGQYKGLIEKDEYDKFKVGDSIDIFVAPNSKIILGINKQNI